MEGTQLSFQGGLIDRIAENEIIQQRVTDGYVNATAMCKACGKLIGHYLSLSSTQAFLTELSSDIGITITELVQSIRGGVPELQGTWVHPHVAINLGQWLSPKFAVAVSRWVAEWMTGSISQPALPYHLRRYMVNMTRVPYGYFSMLNEVTIALIGPLEQMGYTIGSRMIPDISLGRTFSKHLREKGYPVDDYPQYLHSYEDGREVECRAYPNALIGDLRRFFVEEWLKNRSEKYFQERAPEALPYLNKFLSLPNHREIMGYIEI